MTALAMAAGILLLASATAAVARTLVRTRPSAEEVLRRAEVYTREQRSVRFTGQTQVETGASEDRPGQVPAEQSSGFVSRATVSGVVAFPDRARVTVRSDGTATELLTVGERTFGRFADEDEEELPAQRWVAFDPAEEELIGPVDAAVAGLDDPARLRDLIGQATEPRIQRREGRVSVVQARLDVGDGNEGFEELESFTGTLELTAGDDGRVDRMVVDARGEFEDGSSFDARVDFRFSGWGDAFDIVAPDEADIDPTPYVDEERLAAFRDAPLLQPAGIPERWVLDFGDVIPAEDTGEDCDQVELDYVDPDDEEGGYLYIYELPLTCADLQPPVGSQPLRAGPNRGWVTMDPEEGVTAQITVGSTVLNVETDLIPADLARVLGQLVPLDLAVTPSPIPGIGRTRA